MDSYLDRLPLVDLGDREDQGVQQRPFSHSGQGVPDLPEGLPKITLVNMMNAYLRFQIHPQFFIVRLAGMQRGDRSAVSPHI